MSAKMGRPLKGSEKRDKRLEVRLTPTEMAELTEISDKLGVSKTDVIVRAVEELADRLEDK